jgi:branched-chain amino acid transport system permease protein
MWASWALPRSAGWPPYWSPHRRSAAHGLPAAQAWLISALCLAITIGLIAFAYFRTRDLTRIVLITVIGITGYFITRHFFDPAVEAIEKFESASTGYLGGLGLPIVFSWVVGGLFAAAAAWAVGKVTLGLRSDYLAIATLGISEIIIAVLKNEDWLARGVKNVIGLPRPVPYEVDLKGNRLGTEPGR